MAPPFRWGFYVWKLRDCPIEKVIAWADIYGFDAICVKVQDGVNLYNQIGPDGNWTGNDAYLKQYRDAWRASKPGRKFGIWVWIKPKPVLNPGQQAGITGERYQKLDPDFVLVDMEQNDPTQTYWKSIPQPDGSRIPNPYSTESAKTYFNNLQGSGVPLRAPVGAASYRYPDSHNEMPWRQMLKPDSGSVNLTSPQMYWIGDSRADAPEIQLDRCIAQYSERVQFGPDYPMIPAGCMYGQGDWEPTTDQFKNFVEACQNRGIESWLFWSLDWVIAHDRTDWLEAASGVTTPDPPDPPLPPGLATPIGIVVSGSWGSRIREGAGAEWPLVYSVQPGVRFYAYETKQIGPANKQETWILINPGQWLALTYYGSDGIKYDLAYWIVGP